MCNCLGCLSPKHSDSPKSLSKDVENVWTNHQALAAQNRGGVNMMRRPGEKVVSSTSFASDDRMLNFSDIEADTFNSDSESTDTPVTENPFDPKYELWEVVAPRVKVRIQEHRKSKKICDLTCGSVVRCVGRSPGAKRFKIDLPIIGWCSYHTGSPSHPKIFDRVNPSSLPVVDSRFVLELKIGQGSFGKVFVAWDRVENKKVALKIDQPKRGKRSLFDREIAIMKVVTECKNVPSLLSCGCVRTHTQSGKDYDGDDSYEGLQYMIMDLQGVSLSILKKNYLTLFSLKTVLMLGIVFVRILQDVHKLGVLHRDLKPANFVVSRGDRGRNIYILDFGLSVLYRKRDGVHVDYQENSSRCGTARYSSINTHHRIRQSRRDDLEAAGYVLLLFLRDLPWKQKKGESPEKK